MTLLIPPIAGCSKTSGATSPTLQAMHEHDAHGAAMRDAVAAANLSEARREAKTLADLRIDDKMDAVWQGELAAMSVAAQRVVEAKDVDAASHGLAAVARACGDCHAMLGRSGIVVGEAPHVGVDIVPEMRRHQWAVARLWDGLVVPSEDAWAAGAHVLADAPLAPAVLTPDKSPADRIAAANQLVHDLAHRAALAKSAGDREAVYATLMTTCSSCHLWFGLGHDESASDGAARSP
jgi:mono/diheme cytochrome c family protein